MKEAYKGNSETNMDQRRDSVCSLTLLCNFKKLEKASPKCNLSVFTTAKERVQSICRDGMSSQCSSCISCSVFSICFCLSTAMLSTVNALELQQEVGLKRDDVITFCTFLLMGKDFQINHKRTTKTRRGPAWKHLHRSPPFNTRISNKG